MSFVVLAQVMYITNVENNYTMLHQMVPLAAAVFLSRIKDGPPCRKFYSRSYVQIKKKGLHILAQLYFYKCTSSPIHALLINVKSHKTEVLYAFVFFKYILFRLNKKRANSFYYSSSKTLKKVNINLKPLMKFCQKLTQIFVSKQ